MTLPDNLPPLPPKERLRMIHNVPLQEGDLAVACTNPGVFLRVHPSEFGKIANNTAYSFFREIEAVRDAEQPLVCGNCKGKGGHIGDVCGRCEGSGIERPLPTDVEARVCEDALSPFLRVARGIPDNWPGNCILRFDQRMDGSIYLAYHGIHDASGGITIDEWRKLLERAKP